MATYDASDLVVRFQEQALRPAADEITSTQIYRWLTRAQNKVIADIAFRAPWVLYGPPTAMVTVDGGFTYQFSSPDPDGYPIVPIGKVKIFTSLAAIPWAPWTEGYDYLSEGYQIRIPNNRSYTATTLYYRGITQPKDIAAGGSNEPALLPEASRELIVIEAVRDFASQGNRLPDLAASKAQEYGTPAPGVSTPGEFARWMGIWKTQFAGGGGLGGSVPYNGSLLGAYLAGIVVSP